MTEPAGSGFFTTKSTVINCVGRKIRLLVSFQSHFSSCWELPKLSRKFDKSVQQKLLIVSHLFLVRTKTCFLLCITKYCPIFTNFSSTEACFFCESINAKRNATILLCGFLNSFDYVLFGIDTHRFILAIRQPKHQVHQPIF